MCAPRAPLTRTAAEVFGRIATVCALAVARARAVVVFLADVTAFVRCTDVFDTVGTSAARAEAALPIAIARQMSTTVFQVDFRPIPTLLPRGFVPPYRALTRLLLDSVPAP